MIEHLALLLWLSNCWLGSFMIMKMILMVLMVMVMAMTMTIPPIGEWVE